MSSSLLGSSTNSLFEFAANIDKNYDLNIKTMECKGNDKLIEQNYQYQKIKECRQKKEIKNRINDANARMSKQNSQKSLHTYSSSTLPKDNHTNAYSMHPDTDSLSDLTTSSFSASSHRCPTQKSINIVKSSTNNISKSKPKLKHCCDDLNELSLTNSISSKNSCSSIKSTSKHQSSFTSESETSSSKSVSSNFTDMISTPSYPTPSNKEISTVSFSSSTDSTLFNSSVSSRLKHSSKSGLKNENIYHNGKPNTSIANNQNSFSRSISKYYDINNLSSLSTSEVTPSSIFSSSDISSTKMSPDEISAISSDSKFSKSLSLSGKSSSITLDTLIPTSSTFPSLTTNITKTSPMKSDPLSISKSKPKNTTHSQTSSFDDLFERSSSTNSNSFTFDDVSDFGSKQKPQEPLYHPHQVKRYPCDSPDLALDTGRLIGQNQQFRDINIYNYQCPCCCKYPHQNMCQICSYCPKVIPSPFTDECFAKEIGKKKEYDPNVFISEFNHFASQKFIEMDHIIGRLETLEANKEKEIDLEKQRMKRNLKKIKKVVHDWKLKHEKKKLEEKLMGVSEKDLLKLIAREFYPLLKKNEPITRETAFRLVERASRKIKHM